MKNHPLIKLCAVLAFGCVWLQPVGMAVAEADGGTVVDVTANGDVVINRLKIKPRANGEAPRELEILEKSPPEIPPLPSRTNLYVYRRLGMVASARVDTDASCDLFLEPDGSAELPNVKFSGTLRFRGKEFRFSQDEPLRKSDFEGLLTKEEREWPAKNQLCFHLSPPSSLFLHFQENGVLSEVCIHLLPKRERFIVPGP